METHSLKKEHSCSECTFDGPVPHAQWHNSWRGDDCQLRALGTPDISSGKHHQWSRLESYHRPPFVTCLFTPSLLWISILFFNKSCAFYNLLHSEERCISLLHMHRATSPLTAGSILWVLVSPESITLSMLGLLTGSQLLSLTGQSYQGSQLPLSMCLTT